MKIPPCVGPCHANALAIRWRAPSCIALGLLAYWLVGERVIEAAFHGESIGLLNAYLESHRLKDPLVRDLQFYHDYGFATPR